ncbi:MAG: hypothetical protein ACR2O6_05955 [Ilumatobacteraceae bacterium]
MAEAVVRPAIGAPAPDVDLSTLDGERWRLTERAGHTVALIFNRHIH